ncbi:aspartic peptidase domain-containing protein [Paraphoma chrysanthemicola]|uniref:Aspartic peptidase domain-containing protein n=1 Tax=Paraphoma chrysanthemicola TaxID=798071 RepID=A0A8K0VV19_9PLEO|nr:aspartic peptidase domain-containing protein [Paraphoma chrysanthemicola]
MAPLALYLSATVLFAQSTLAFNCSKKPIYVDIHRRAVHDSPVFQYGSFIGLGTPAQNQSLWPSITQNHTSFASHEYCQGNSTLKNCDSSTGGFYKNEDSTSFVAQPNLQSLDRGNNITGFFGQESLRLYTHYFETEGASQTLIENSIVEVATQGSIIPGRLGMGSSSTVLRDLAAKDMIAGKTYSLYIGQGFDRAGGLVNGSNVFGGYDSGRFTGAVNRYTMNIANTNAMSVRIKDIVITGSNDNSNVSLFDSSVFTEMKSAPPVFEAQITTEQFPFSFPYQITRNFIAHLGAQKDNTWGDNSLKLKNAFNGTLSIVLEDGFTVTLPPEVLMNASNITPVQDRPEDSKLPFTLGTAFLGQVYLMADYETNNFFLAKAIQKNNMVMPVSFCPKATPAPYQSPKQTNWTRQGLVGAVVGGVIGGMGALAALYCLWVVWTRKKDERRLKKELKRNSRMKMEQLDVEEAPSFDPPPSKASKAAFWKKSGQ